MSDFDDDELTDIRQLPDLDEEQEDQFQSLDDIASDIGFETNSDDEDEDNTEVTDVASLSELPDSPPDFDFDGDAPLAEDTFESETNFDNDIEFSTEDESVETDFEINDSDDFGSDFEDEPLETLPDEKEESLDEIEDEDSFDLSAADNDFEDEELETQDTTLADDDFKPTSEFIQEEELAVAAPVIEKVAKTLIPANSTEKTHNTSPEDFEEIKDFAKNMRHQNFSSEGNPPFSIILKHIKYIEDAEEIADILIKFKIAAPETKEDLIKNLSRGIYLVPRLSEFAAITLCHQLRMFNLEILMGLTEEVNPPKSYESSDRGSTSKRTLLANRKHNFNLKDKPLYSEILTTTLPQLSGYQIVEYMGIASESRIIDNETLTLTNAKHLESEILEELDESERDNLKLLQLKRNNQKASESKFGFNYEDFYGKNTEAPHKLGLEHIYAELMTNIKTMAKTANANAIVGISFSISPISLEEYLNQGPRYQVLCTGNMVWIEKT